MTFHASDMYGVCGHAADVAAAKTPEAQALHWFYLAPCGQDLCTASQICLQCRRRPRLEGRPGREYCHVMIVDLFGLDS